MGIYYQVKLFYGYINGNDIYKKISYQCSDSLGYEVGVNHRYNYQIIKNFVIKNSKKEYNECLGYEGFLDWYLYTNCFDTYGNGGNRGTVCIIRNIQYLDNVENIVIDNDDLLKIEEEINKLNREFNSRIKGVIDLDYMDFDKTIEILTNLKNSYKKYKSMLYIIEIMYISRGEAGEYIVMALMSNGSKLRYELSDVFNKNPRVLEEYLVMHNSELNSKIIELLGINFSLKLIKN